MHLGREGHGPADGELRRVDGLAEGRAGLLECVVLLYEVSAERHVGRIV